MTWTLHHGDCLDPVSGLASLPDKSVDHVITDPPYDEHTATGSAGSARRGERGERGRAGQEIVRKADLGVGFLRRSDIEVLCANAVRVARGWVVAFCAFEQIWAYRTAIENAGGRYVRCCAWEKPDATPQFTGDRPATWGECIVVAWAEPEVRLSWNGGGKRGLYRAGVCRGHERSDHPTQKPLSLMVELLTDFTDPGDSVLDPFAGSGTTGVACNQLGRNFIGWERDANYHAIASRRLNGDEAKPRPEQPSLFGGA